MGKVVDITAKLGFEENPKLVIQGIEYEVNADALSMLKVMQFMSFDNPGGKEIMDAYIALFSEKERKKLEELKLQFSDFVTITQEAVSLVVGGENSRGE